MAKPPPTPLKEVVDMVQGVEIRDPYRWLEDAADPEVQRWVDSQRQHARAYLDALPARRAIAARLEAALGVGALGPSTPRQARRFFVRRGPDMNQPALYVWEGGVERVLVDPNPLSPDGTTALDWYYLSSDGALACVGISEAGDERSTLTLVEVATGRSLPDRIDRCRWASVAFEPDNGAILYTRFPAPGSVPAGEENYHRHLWRHVLGEEPDQDVKVFGEGMPLTDTIGAVSVSEDGRWTVVTVSHGSDRSTMVLREQGGDFTPIPGTNAASASARFVRDRLVALTNLDAPNWRLVEIDPRHPDPAGWRVVIAESEHALVDVRFTSDRILADRLVRACSQVSVHTAEGAFERRLDTPELSSVTGVGAHHSSAVAYLTVETFTRPAQTYEVDPRRGATAVLDQVAPPASFDAGRHPVRQVVYPSRDGTAVKMFLVGRSEGMGPTVLTGYGGFNVARTPAWTPTLIPFLEAGGLFAVANLRGGGEYGEGWHRAGMLGSKQNVFDDFIAAAEWLLEERWCAVSQLGIMGGSNGGLLVGAAMTQRPDLFGAVVCRVPLLDMVRYEGFQVARIWSGELGSAADPEQFAWLHAYSPYHHVVDGTRYPPTLITAGEEDGRVDPLHARKMAARLQAADPQGLILLRVEPRAGHGQGKPVTKKVPEEADIWAFLQAQLGEA